MANKTANETNCLPLDCGRWVVATKFKLREMLPDGLICMARNEADPREIVEMWF